MNQVIHLGREGQFTWSKAPCLRKQQKDNVPICTPGRGETMRSEVPVLSKEATQGPCTFTTLYTGVEKDNVEGSVLSKDITRVP